MIARNVYRFALRHHACALASVLLLAIPTLAQNPEPPECAIWVVNPSDSARREIVRASIPFPCGRLRDGEVVSVAGNPVHGVPLIHWPDGSIAVLQAHLPMAVAPGRHRFAVEVVDAAAQVPEAEWHFDSGLELMTELVDPWGQEYRARLAGDWTLMSPGSPLVRTWRLQGVHRRGESEFLGLVAYLTAFVGERRAELTLVLDNGAQLTDRPALGPVRFSRFTLVGEDEHLLLLPRFAMENSIRSAVPVEGGGLRLDLFAPSDQLYLGDRTAKAFRLDLLFDDPEATEGERRAARQSIAAPLTAWPDLAWVRHTGAFGAHGGPAPAREDLAKSKWSEWRNGSRLGVFAGHGDPEDAAAQGTIRNGPSALHNVLRWQYPPLLRVAETVVLQQCLRPTPGHELRRPDDMVEVRSGLEMRLWDAPHGFTALDYEHFSVGILYDYFWLTGDPLAQAEMRRVGSGLIPLLEGLPFQTSRGEGWCLQSGVLIARATGDRALVEALAQRARTRVIQQIRRPPSPAAIAQPGHEDAFGGVEEFDAPWQMAALVHGLHAIFSETGDRSFADAAVRTARIMAGPGWVDGVGPKYLVSARRVGRYTLPVGHGPMEGTALMQIGAFVLAGEMAEEPEYRQAFARRAATLALANGVPANTDLFINPWFQLYFDRAPEDR